MEITLADVTLPELEERIETGMKVFLEVGTCLLEIRDRRLYKEQGYSRFEDYLNARWPEISRQRAYQLMDAAKMSTIVDKVGLPAPETESQARELASLIKRDEQKAIETWRELQEKHGSKITAEIIRNAVRDEAEADEETDEMEDGCWNCMHSKTDTSDYDQFWCNARERTLSFHGDRERCEYWKPEEAESEEIPQPKPHISYNSGNNEWYTPPEYIEAARNVMGNIELDPASSELANETVRAGRFFTAQNDGLKQEWNGRVWMNPPYAAELISKFCCKLAEYYKSGSVPEAIVLVNNATETSWFNTLIEQASAVVFPRARVKFRMPNGETGAPLQGQAVIYFGRNFDSFLAEFKKFGWGAKL